VEKKLQRMGTGRILLTCLLSLAIFGGIAAPAAQAGVTMTNIGSFSISGTKPATGQAGYYGNAVAFVPADQDSIDQNTLIITWAQTDPINASRRLFLFHRITIPAPGGTPTILATATLPSDVTIAGTPIGATTTGTRDLVYDPITKKVVGSMTVSGNRLLAFDLFSTNVTLSSVSYSAPTGDSQSFSECFFLTNDGRYTAFYKTSTANWRKISLGRNELDGATPFVKMDVPISSFTGWYPDPSAYQYATDGFCPTGGAGFYGSTAVVIRSFKNSLNAGYQECRLYAVGQTMDAAAINAYMDLGAVPGLTNSSHIGYGMAFDKATGNTYVRSGYINDPGSPSYNKIFMVNLASSCDAIAPDAVTDLTAGNIEPRALTLSWTAPADASGIFDGAASYNIRYSTSLIDDTNWDAATQVANDPQPSSAGSTDSMVITGLTAATDYYFAVKSIDTCGNVSALSNVAGPIRTDDPDITPPAAVSDLSFSDLHTNSLVLHWTATGDDGMTGQAVSYDLRYSFSPIDDTNFASATPIAVAAPKAPGSAESLEMHGLTAGVTYYFAIKVTDEWPLTSNISNILAVPMPAPDPFAPDAITDLRLVGAQSSTAYIRWTAPADVGSAGVARYEIRYSTSPIDETNWTSATVAPNPPAAAAPGTTINGVVTGLVGDTDYFVAVKSIDWAEPANVSAVSNVITFKTRTAIAAIALQNPWITNDRVADTRSLQSMAATFGTAYTPNGVIAATSDQETAINVYNNFKRREYHWADDPPNRGDIVRNMNIHGHSLCGGHASQNASLLNAMGFGVRTGSIASGAHTLHEVYYDGDWHLMDTMTTMYVFDRGNPPSIASAAEIKADKTLMTSAVAEGRACPGFLLCPDDVVWFANGTNSWSIIGTPGATATTHSMNMNLRFGEALNRTWESWLNQHTTPRTNADSLAGLDPPYHHDARNDWKDYVNFPYWEPYALTTQQYTDLGIGYGYCYRRWANGSVELRPDFTSAGYQAAVHGTPLSISTLGADGLMPELHPAAANTLGEIVFKVSVPYYITDANISGEFVRTGGNDIARLFISSTGTSFTQIWDHTGLGTTQVTNLNVRSTVFSKQEFYIKVQLKGVANKTDAGVNNLVIQTTFQYNKGSLAYLDKGVNQITVTFDNPAELAVSGAAFKVTYQWKEYDGTGWNIARSHEQYVLTSPTTFTITTNGTKVPRTESIKMELSEPPFDPDAPAAVTDLAVESTDSSVVGLTWTATGDDDLIGQASLYDIRYATSPILDGTAWEAATQATGEPAPATAGTVEHFLVTGLEASTDYWFAIKVADKMPNWSGLSNSPMGRTADPDIIPPAWVGNLIARPSKTSGAVDLTWTASGDDENTGTATAYYVRYSTSPIAYDDGDASWNAATPVAGLPTPKVAGSAETFTVTGLTGGTEYYFALKVADERPNLSEVSNCSSAIASHLGEKVLQNGTNSYNGCRDNYTQSSGPTLNFGSYERMRVTAYAELGDTQRGYIKFDLSGIPAGTVIREATLWLYSYDTTKMTGSTGYYAAHRLTRSWGEMTMNWNLADVGVSWTTPGGDYEATADALSPKNPNKVPQWYQWDLTTRAQQWINNSAGNYGWLIRAQNETSHIQDQFYQSDTAAAQYRPKLIISDLPDPVAGDISGDGSVDVVDLLYLVESFGLSLGERGYEPKCDLASDNTIDVVDLLTLVENWPQ
jgi:hypothetical protein